MREQEKSENMFDVYGACYWYGADYHDGQGSNSYRLLSIVSGKYRPGPMEDAESWYNNAGQRGKDLFDALIERNY